MRKEIRKRHGAKEGPRQKPAPSGNLTRRGCGSGRKLVELGVVSVANQVNVSKWTQLLRRPELYSS